MDGMVMRSVFLRPQEDSQLRQLAHELHVSKSDLIRSAISAKLKQWLEDPSDKSVLADLELGRRNGAAGNRSPGSKNAAAQTNVEQASEARGKAPASPKARAGGKKPEKKLSGASPRKASAANQEKAIAV